MIGRAMSIGMAKPMPLLSAAIAVLMPTTLPSASSSGPPELPGLIAASVWMRLLRCWSPSVVIERPLAETMPLVTEFEYVPSGLPMATTSWPTLSASESPRRGRGRSGRVDLDDREVGQRVDAVDRAREARGRP